MRLTPRLLNRVAGLRVCYSTEIKGPNMQAGYFAKGCGRPHKLKHESPVNMPATSYKAGRASWSAMIQSEFRAWRNRDRLHGSCQRKFFELHATNKSTLAEQALRYIQLRYEIESEVRDLEPDLRRRIRQEKAVPVMDMLHPWMIAERDLVP